MIVFANGDEEEDGCHIFETMDPFLSFGTLTANVKHSVCKVADDECCFCDTSGLDTGAQHVLIGGEIVWLRNSIDRVEVTQIRSNLLKRTNTILQNRSVGTRDFVGNILGHPGRSRDF